MAEPLRAVIPALLDPRRLRLVHRHLLRPGSRAARLVIGTGGSASTWLYTVARNIVIDERRTTRRYREIMTDRLPEQPIGDASEQVVNHHLLATALGRLTQEHRDVLRECYFRGSSVAQAAQALGIAPGTVKSRTYYALRALQLALEELGDVE